MREEEETLSTLLSVTKATRSLFHHDNPTTMPGGSFVSASLLQSLSKEATNFFEANIALHEDPMSVAVKTTGQSKSPRWNAERKFRISSTKAHGVWIRKRDFESLVNRMLSQKKFTSRATSYGTRNESVARKALEALLSTKIFETGLVVLPYQPWLCCSPDGLVCINGETVVTEIKCPYSREGLPVVDEAGKVSFVKYLTYVDDKLTLKKSHEYFTQIQVQMYIMNLSKAILYVYSSVQSVYLYINRDDEFLLPLIAKLEHFFFTKLLPCLQPQNVCVS
ncbi:uncharacterized protein LOC135386943 [Ornithodoros turicata]|uniref:uncharacterized protein LOC135386943 n=1 Tax=Ornithodoros turicata TaxID=34597 RepID=UPI003138AE85